mmetsp:Transcript_38799/g.93788  ORF Transcript_38799/g.93788 Transcript_38799/m.93788 type:complete len:92 (-) Transcript_38799:1298-1573(-)
MFSDYVDFMARKMTDPGHNEEDILDCFSVFDAKKDGKVNAKELKDVLCKMGEPMTGAEVEGVFKDAEIDDEGMINYKDFIKRLNDMYEIFT